MFALAVPASAVAGFALQVLQPVAGLFIAVSGGVLARAVSSVQTRSVGNGQQGPQVPAS